MAPDTTALSPPVSGILHRSGSLYWHNSSDPQQTNVSWHDSQEATWSESSRSTGCPGMSAGRVSSGCRCRGRTGMYGILGDEIFVNKACHPGGHYWDYYTGVLSWCQVSAIHWKMGYPKMKFTGAQSLNELQRLDYMTGYQGSNGCQLTCTIELNYSNVWWFSTRWILIEVDKRLNHPPSAAYMHRWTASSLV